METRVHSPTSNIYSAGDDYVHALEVSGSSRMLFVSGTMGLDPQGKAGATLDDQLVLIWNNLRVILASAGMTVDNVVRLTSYLTDRAHADVNAKARVEALKGRVVPTTAIVVTTLDPAWLIEIEIVAMA